MLRSRCGLLGLLAWLAAAGPAADFTFWHFSDSHSPVAGSTKVIAAAAQQGEVVLTPYGLTAAKPAFAVLTGDLTEFGAGDGAWDNHHKQFGGFTIPLYPLPGNHDNTWWTIRPTLAAEGRRPPYAFDHGGCHFIVLDTAGRQDPRPAFAAEEVAWLAAHLRTVDPATPLFVACHHPLVGSEWASAYDAQRVLELLQGHNLVLFLVGHGHGHKAARYGDCDAIMGGSTFDGGVPGWAGGHAGFAVVDLRDGRLRAAYRRYVDEAANVAMLEKSLAPRPVLPRATFTAPGDAAVRGDQVAVAVHWAGDPAATGTVMLGNGQPVPLARAGDAWTTTVPLADLPPGRYVLRARFVAGERVALASREFVRAVGGGARALWRRDLRASVRGALAVGDDTVYAATQAGELVALDRASGAERWRFATQGECLAGPCLVGDQIVVAATTGALHAIGRDGRERWRHDCGRALVAPPAVHRDIIVAPGLDGVVTAVDLSGARRWQAKVADYTLETAACPAGDDVVLGAWDTFIRGVSLATGAVRWKTVGEGSSKGGPARYYSPADCAPTAAGGRLYVADRRYHLIILDAATGARVGALEQVSATAAAPDGQAVYLRRAGAAGQRLTKLRAADSQELWTVPVPGGYLPAAPVERDGVVAVTSDSGLVTAVAPTDGRVLWQYRANAGFWVPGGAVPAGGAIYVAGLDGAVTSVVGP